jgi:carbamoyl-phosphate synthase small subunit
MRRKGALLLADGTLWKGVAWGAKTTQVGECVFHTGHTGYQEIATDPSYCKQIMVFSAPQIGNQGFTEEDAESAKVWTAGLVVRDYSEPLYHWRMKKTMNEFLIEHEVPALSGVDTRRLILHLREHGAQWGVISTELSDKKSLEKFLAKPLSMEGLSLTSQVSTSKPYRWTEGSHVLLRPTARNSSGLKKIVVIDFGVKRQILRCLVDAGFDDVVVMPRQSSAEEILKQSPDALLLSNGPGDPATETFAVEQVKKLVGKIPILGICLGHQILGQALGMKTFKLKFGHHAANHPVMNGLTDHVEITSQNHGFAVSAEKLPEGIEMTHFNLNDQTVEGFIGKKLRVQGIQFHPEAGPGPLDSRDVFTKFQSGRDVA